jgi:hypothetical protein
MSIGTASFEGYTVTLIPVVPTPGDDDVQSGPVAVVPLLRSRTSAVVSACTFLSVLPVGTATQDR